jgi:hypothetical protein
MIFDFFAVFAALSISFSSGYGQAAPLPGDLNGDGFVDDTDANIWLGDPTMAVDMNGDTFVDKADFDIAHGLGTQPPPPGGLPGDPDGAPVAEGNVTHINFEDRTFEIESGDGSIRKVIVQEHTVISLTFEGGGDGPFPGDDGGFGDGGGFGTFGQFQDPNDPGDGPAPEGRFEDIQNGVFVVVFGEVADNGDILADFVEVFLGGGGPGPGDGILGAFEPIIRQILSEAGGGIALDLVDLEGLEDHIIDLLFDAAGDDRVLSLNELDQLVGFDPSFPGRGGFDGELLFEGDVVSINHEARTFEVQLEDESVETVSVDEGTQFVIRLEGDSGFGPPPGDHGGFSTFGQFDGGGDPSVFVSATSADSLLFQGIAFFEDMEEGDFVEVFGEEQEDGTALATGVKIIRDFSGGGGGFSDFPVAYGHVVQIDIDNNFFEVEEAPGLRNRVNVTDETVFEVETFSFNPEPFPGDESFDGSFKPAARKSAARKTTTRRQFEDGDGFQPPPRRLVTFSDLEIDDDADIFGSFNEDGSIAATRVLIFRGDEPPEPDLFGHVDDIDFDELTITISGDDDEPIAVQLTEETFIGLIYGNFGGDDPFFNPGPEPGQFDGNGTTDFKPAAKQTTGDDFIEPPPGVFFDEFRKFEDIQITMTVAIYLVDDEASDPVASAIIILNGGARQRGFEVAARIDFVDEFGGHLFFQPPSGVQVPAGIPITLGSGNTVNSLRELREALSSVQTFRFQPRFLRIFADDGPDPDIKIATEIQVVPLGEDLFQGEEDIFARIDDVFGQIVDHEGRIYPSPPTPVRFNRNTFFGDVEGNEIDFRQLGPGTQVDVEGLENIFPGEFEGERIADYVMVIGGQPFEFDGFVESVDTDEGTFTLGVDDPEPISNRAFYGGFFGEPLSPEAFIDQFESGDGSQIVVQFNPFGPGIVRLQLHNPQNPRPFRGDESIFEQFEVSVVDVDEGYALVFNQLPDFELGEGAVLRDRDGDDIGLEDLVGKNVFIEGEVFNDLPVVLFVKVFDSVDDIEIVVEIGDFDEEGSENDVILRVFDSEGNEVDGDFNVFLDFLPPATVQSGAIARNQGPGVHRVEVEVPSLVCSQKQSL